jgi:hypothetical protein
MPNAKVLQYLRVGEIRYENRIWQDVYKLMLKTTGFWHLSAKIGFLHTEYGEIIYLSLYYENEYLNYVSV